MKLPAFQAFEPFIRLREQMGVSDLASFGDDSDALWVRLSKRGIDIEDINEVIEANDGTLDYEGHRILVYIRDQYLDREGNPPTTYRYHVAECQTLENMRRDKRFGRYVGTNRKDGSFVVNYLDYLQGSNGDLVQEDLEVELHVCKNCLKRLDWQGYANTKHKPKKTRVWLSFTPEAFFDEYTTQVVCLPVHDEYDSPYNNYPSDWTEISRTTRELAKWRCQKCQFDASTDKSLRKYLHVHHIDGNKPNNDQSNLIALCIGCHAKEPHHGHLKKHPHYKKYLKIAV